MKTWWLIPAILFASSCSGATLTTRIVDGLERPLAEVLVTLEYRGDTWTGTSDGGGRVAIEYDDRVDLDDAWVRISKPGYAGYSSSSAEPVFQLLRDPQHNFEALAGLSASARYDALRELLASDLEKLPDGAWEALFVHGEALREPLRALVEDPRVGRTAVEMLAQVGHRDDLRYVLAHRPPFEDVDGDESDGMENRWAYAVVSSLVAPAEEIEWAFLEACASGRSGDRWVDAGAITALSLSADPRAARVLEKAAQSNADRRASIERLLARRAQQPALADTDPLAVAKAVAEWLDVGRLMEMKPPRMNSQGDLAAVDLTFRSGRDQLGYVALFAKDHDRWRLTAIRETHQALMDSD